MVSMQVPGGPELLILLLYAVLLIAAVYIPYKLFETYRVLRNDRDTD